MGSFVTIYTFNGFRGVMRKTKKLTDGRSVIVISHLVKQGELKKVCRVWINLIKTTDHGKKNPWSGKFVRQVTSIWTPNPNTSPSDNQSKTRPAYHETMILNAGDALNSSVFTMCHFLAYMRRSLEWAFTDPTSSVVVRLYVNISLKRLLKITPIRQWDVAKKSYALIIFV